MPDNKSDGEANSMAEASPDKDVDDSSEFVEVDPTGRYGRYDDVLGKGAFKTVYRAFDEVDGIEVAWNQVKVQDVLQSPEDLERLYSEVHLLKTLKHKNIIKFYNSWVDTKTKNVNFITEIFTSGTLRQYRKRHKHVDIKAVKNWSRQILRGLLYLHSHDPPIIHRDLKCDNIFVNGNQGEVKIGDLGLAAILRQAHAAHSVIGTPEFMAPELYEEEYNELVDIYSFGMCLLEMVTFEYPYSECTNAAQIYKKVTAGKKPAALDKVKDPEVRAFVEKCLATASRRLPARELLMDPFLQCEGNREALVDVQCIALLKMQADGMDELGMPEEHVSMPILGETYHGQKVALGERQGSENRGEERPSTSASKSLPRMPISGKSKSEEDERHAHNRFVNEKYSKEDRPRRSKDFRLKGKKRDDDTIFLRLRIANPEGHIRNIHFPFNIEADSAMSVASEMVAELDLSDQDITTIAEMIDVEILALVPEWNPGVALDENGVNDREHGLPSDEDNHGNVQEESDVVATISSEGSGVDHHPSSRKARLYSPKGATLVLSPPRVEGTMHGRFEEVTYHSKVEHSGRGSDVPPVFSSDSSEARDEEWDLGGGHTSTPKSTISLANSGSPAHEPYLSNKDATLLETCHSESGDFNELVERRRKAGTAKFFHEAWEGMTEDSQRFDLDCRSDCAISHSDDNEAVSQELELLALRQQLELQELQWRHEQALLAIKNRHRHKLADAERRFTSPDTQNVSIFDGFHHKNFHTLEPRTSPANERNKIYVKTGSGKLPLEVEDAKKLSRLSSADSAPLNSSFMFVAAPKAFGLGHNLQGHLIIEPYNDRKPSFGTSGDPEASEAINHMDHIVTPDRSSGGKYGE